MVGKGEIFCSFSWKNLRKSIVDESGEARKEGLEPELCPPENGREPSYW
jgi:hypothetical protein